MVSGWVQSEPFFPPYSRLVLTLGRTADSLATNSGQICFAPTRVYVQSGIYNEFIEAYAKALKDKVDVLGDPEKDGIEIGPVVDKAQYERILGFINNTMNKQEGDLVVGGADQASKVINSGSFSSSSARAKHFFRAISSNQLSSRTHPRRHLSTRMRSSALSPSSTNLRRKMRSSTDQMTVYTDLWPAYLHKT